MHALEPTLPGPDRGSWCGCYHYPLLIKWFAGASPNRFPDSMPIYEYRCSNCGHTLESLQKFSDAPLVECPHCHRPDLRKMVSPVGFKLKGSGWYVTDFRNSGAKPAAKSGDATAGNSESSAKDRAGADVDNNGARSNGEQPAAASGSEGATAGQGATGKAESASSGPKHADSGKSTGSASSTGSGSGSGSGSDSSG